MALTLTTETRLAYCQSDPWSRGQAAAYCCPCDGEQAWRGRGQKRWNVGRRPPSTPLRSTSAHPLLQPLARMLRRIGNRSPSRQQFVPRRTTTPGKLTEHCALQVESPVHPSLPFAIFLVQHTLCSACLWAAATAAQRGRGCIFPLRVYRVRKRPQPEIWNLEKPTCRCTTEG